MEKFTFLVEYTPGEFEQVIEISDKFDLQYHLADLIKRFFIPVNGTKYSDSYTISESLVDSIAKLNFMLFRLASLEEIDKEHIDYLYNNFYIKLTRVDDRKPKYKNYIINHVMEETANGVFISVTPEVYDAILNDKRRRARYKLLSKEHLDKENVRWYIVKTDKHNQFKIKYTEPINGSPGYLIHFNKNNTYDGYFKTYEE